MDVGTRYNVIAENARLEGTLRCFNNTTRAKVAKSIEHYAKQTAAIYGGTAEMIYKQGTQPVINDEKSALLVQETITESFGEEMLYFERPTTGGEDSAIFKMKLRKFRTRWLRQSRKRHRMGPSPRSL